ncbi:MAG: hypothetical protein ACI4R8_01110 [Candidatus Caccovivens sp.]
MSKILEKNGVENNGLDAARFNRFCSAYKDGVLKKSFNECAVTALSSNSFQIDKGELLICGFRIISEAVQFTFNTFPVSLMRYHVIAQLTMDETKDITFQYIAREVSPLRQDDLLNENISAGIYQIEIARFTLTIESVTDINKTVDTISSRDFAGDAINIGEITTNKIDLDLNAEVDINERIDDTGKKFWDFTFNLPINLSNIIDNVTQEALKKVQESVSVSPIYVHYIRLTGRATASFGYVANLMLISPSKKDRFTRVTEYLDYVFSKHAATTLSIEVSATGAIYSGSPSSATKKGELIAFLYNGEDNTIAFRYYDISQNEIVSTVWMNAEYVSDEGITYMVNVDDTILTMD